MQSQPCHFRRCMRQLQSIPNRSYARSALKMETALTISHQNAANKVAGQFLKKLQATTDGVTRRIKSFKMSKGLFGFEVELYESEIAKRASRGDGAVTKARYTGDVEWPTITDTEQFVLPYLNNIRREQLPGKILPEEHDRLNFWTWAYANQPRAMGAVLHWMTLVEAGHSPNTNAHAAERTRDLIDDEDNRLHKEGFSFTIAVPNGNSVTWKSRQEAMTWFRTLPNQRRAIAHWVDWDTFRWIVPEYEVDRTDKFSFAFDANGLAVLLDGTVHHTKTNHTWTVRDVYSCTDFATIEKVNVKMT